MINPMLIREDGFHKQRIQFCLFNTKPFDADRLKNHTPPMGPTIMFCFRSFAVYFDWIECAQRCEIYSLERENRCLFRNLNAFVSHTTFAVALLIIL